MTTFYPISRQVKNLLDCPTPLEDGFLQKTWTEVYIDNEKIIQGYGPSVIIEKDDKYYFNIPWLPNKKIKLSKPEEQHRAIIYRDETLYGNLLPIDIDKSFSGLIPLQTPMIVWSENEC